MRSKYLRGLAVLPVIGLIYFGICQKSSAQSTNYFEIESRIEEKTSNNAVGVSSGDTVSFAGLMEADVMRRDKNEVGGVERDFGLVTVELSIGLELSAWAVADFVLLFEDSTFSTETEMNLDSSTITFSDTNRFPFFLSIGKMYLPFGALLTSFPDASMLDAPVTLTFGEIRETAVLAGYDNNGIALSAYLFNGEINKDNDSSINSFGMDAQYTFEAQREGLDAIIGASYVSNIADTDGFTNAFTTDTLENNVGGFAAYLHLGYQYFNIDLEYMTALDDFIDKELLSTTGVGARPSVWNMEFGVYLDWWKPLQVAFKYAGSHEAEALGIPVTRQGIVLNQNTHDNVVVSVGLLLDRFDKNFYSDGPNKQSTVFSQVAIVF